MAKSEKSPLCMNCKRAIGLDSPDDLRPSSSDIIQKFLNTNHCPPPDEFELAHKDLVASEQAIHDTTEEIARTMEYLKHLKEKKSILKAYSIGMKAVLHPIRRIPGEILSQIFSFCLDSSPLSEETIFCDSLDIRSMQWVLSQVCVQWRSVALNQPSLLWSNVHMRIEDRTSTPGRSLLLGLHLRRSSSCPLSVFLSGASYFRNTDHRAILGILLHADRWVALRIEQLSITFIQKHLLYVKPLLTGLQTLTWRPSEAFGGICDVFQAASGLKQVHLNRLRDDIVQIPFSSRNVTKLLLEYIQFTDPHRLLDILRNASELLDFTLKTPVISQSSVELGSTVTLDRLIRWKFDEGAANCGNVFIDHLILPSLSVFHSGNGMVDLPHIGALFQRSGCNITELNLEDTNADEGLLMLLKDQPSLSVLVVSSYPRGNISQDFISSLVCDFDGNADCQLPHLRELHLLGAMAFDATVYISMVQSRLHAHATNPDKIKCRLQCVSLQCQTLPQQHGALGRFYREEIFEELQCQFFRQTGVTWAGGPEIVPMVFVH